MPYYPCELYDRCISIQVNIKTFIAVIQQSKVIFWFTLISENVIALAIRYISSRHVQKGLEMYEEVMKGCNSI